jgi:hypothetical protein
MAQTPKTGILPMYNPNVSDRVAATTLTDVVNTLTHLGCQPTRSGAGYTAYCPIHEIDGSTHTKSLTLSEGHTQPVIVHCHAGCDPNALLNALDIHPAQTEVPIRRITHRYSYCTADGHEIRQKVRYEPKDFRIRHKKNGHWDYKAGSGPAVLYRLPEVCTAISHGETIYLVEGEKDADRLAALSLVATTSIEGAWQPGQKPKWKPEYTAQLKGAACVVLLPDHDEAGRAYMNYIGQQLMGQVREIIQVDLGQLYGLPPKSDVSDWLNAGHTVEDLQEQVARANPPLLNDAPSDDQPALGHPTAEPEKPCFVWVQDFCALPPTEVWSVEDYLEPDTLCVLYGDSEAYKSFLAVDIACHIATGKSWRGKTVKPGIVLYIAGEGGNGLRKRFRAWFEYHQEPMRNIAISTVPRALCDPVNVAKLVTTLKQFLKGMPEKPILIATDTLNTHFGDGDENSTADMTRFMSGLRTLRIATGATILVPHHCGLAAKDRSRGSIVLRNGIDWEYRLERRPDSQTTTLTCTKCKDHEKPAPLSWNLETVSLPWADPKGRPLYSAVLVPNDSMPAALPAKEKMGHQQRRALKLLEELHRQHQQNLAEAGHDPQMACVRLEDWQNAMQDITEDRGSRNRIRRILLDNGYIRIENGFVYPTNLVR